MKKILVTGAAGFIGSHCCKALRKSGYNVFGIHKPFTEYGDTYLTKLKSVRIDKLSGNISRTDISGIVDHETKNTFDGLLKVFKPDIVLHLAAKAGVRQSIKNPETFGFNNILGTLHIFEACRRIGVKNIIYASSSSVYGNSRHIPFAENDETNKPTSIYAMTKMACENMAYTYMKLYGMKTVGLRFFTVYGPYGRPDMAYYKFARKIMKGEPIDVYGNGNLTRDFTYIDDIVDGIISAVDKVETLAPYSIFNLGNENPVSVNHLVELLEKGLGKKAKINHVAQPKADVDMTFADITKAKNLLGYKPKVKFEDGMDKFINWFKNYEK